MATRTYANNFGDESYNPNRFLIYLAAGMLGVGAMVSSCDDNAEAVKEVVKKRKMSGGIKVFTGNANKSLAQEIVKHLDMKLGSMDVGRFSDGECSVQVNENIRGKDIYIVQPTLPPVNENLMELLLIISTMRRASARKITAIIPYYGYARQDRKMQARVPISAADVARLLEAMGVDRVVAVDLHCGQIQGFFRPRVPVDNWMEATWEWRTSDAWIW